MIHVGFVGCNLITPGLYTYEIIDYSQNVASDCRMRPAFTLVNNSNGLLTVIIKKVELNTNFLWFTLPYIQLNMA